MAINTNTIRQRRGLGSPGWWQVSGPMRHGSVTILTAQGNIARVVGVVETVRTVDCDVACEAVNAIGPLCDEIDRLRAILKDVRPRLVPDAEHLASAEELIARIDAELPTEPTDDQ